MENYQFFRYRAVNSRGRQIRGVISARDEDHLNHLLMDAGMELVRCSPLKKKGLAGRIRLKRKVRIRDLIELLIRMEQMQGAGIPLLSVVDEIRLATEHDGLRDVLSDIHRDITNGSTLSEAMARHPDVFNRMFTSVMGAAEQTGDMAAAYQQLRKYLAWLEQMQTKVRKATRYPLIVLAVVIIGVVIMMTVVVPQITDFLITTGQSLPIWTRALMATSAFFTRFWWVLLLTPLFAWIGIKIARVMSDAISETLDRFFLNMLVVGPLARKINIARFAQTFSALLASGLPLISALAAARTTVSNRAVVTALKDVEKDIQSGKLLSDALNDSGEFPGIVVRMLKAGEESGNLTVVLDQVAEFYTNDVDESIHGLITLVEPALTCVVGGLMLWIAVAVFGPIYSSFDKISF